MFRDFRGKNASVFSVEIATAKKSPNPLFQRGTAATHALLRPSQAPPAIGGIKGVPAQPGRDFTKEERRRGSFPPRKSLKNHAVGHVFA
jgi:hypothetical protein